LKKIFYLFLFFINIAFAENIANAESVESFVNNISIKSTEILSNKTDSDEKKNNKYLDFVDTIVDSDWISKFVLGSYAKQLKQDEFEEFKKLYKKYLLKNYIYKLKDYSERIKIVKVVNKDNNVSIVTIIAQDNMGVDINVDFRIVKKNDKFLVTDIIPEGISFIGSQRTDIGNTFKKDGFNNLINNLKLKVE
jgi:ABC-type transporter MlaC component